MDTNNQEQSRTRKALEYIGRGALAVASPLIYGAVRENKKTVPFKGLSGVIAAVGISLSAHLANSSNLYKDPAVNVHYFPPGVITATAEALLCPAAFILHSDYETNVPTDDRNFFRALGKDIIAFNSQTGRYELKFNENTRFDEGREGLFHRGLDNLAEAKSNLERLTASGDVIGAREATSELERVQAEYHTVRKAFEDAVTKMNSELDSIKQKQNPESKPVEKLK